jgi:hypothetical protein
MTGHKINKKGQATDSLLTDDHREAIIRNVSRMKYVNIVRLLDKISTHHAGTAKTKDKRFVIRKFAEFIGRQSDDNKQRMFFEAGEFLCGISSDNAKEIGVSLICRGFRHNKPETLKQMLIIADDPNWEVREYAGSAFAELLRNNPELHTRIMELTGHDSENIRRAVLFSALAYKEDGTLDKAFEIIERLAVDDSAYVKRNLGPFILGSHFGNRYPKETIDFLEKLRLLNHPNADWNIAMSFNNSFGNRYPNEALNLLSSLVGSEHKSVRNAVISTLRHLSKRHGTLVEKFCRKYLIKTKKSPMKSETS